MNFDLDFILQIAGLLLGLIYLYLEYKANKNMWLVGMVMPMISTWIFFRKGLYADFGMSCYYFVMAVYGYIVWSFGISPKRNEKTEHLKIRSVSTRVAVGSLVVMNLCWVVLYYGLSRFTDSTVPIPDAFTTAASIVGTWMLARKYVEQWIVWVVVDAVSTCLYIYKGIPFYALLYAVYTVIAVMGYFKWRRMALAETSKDCL